VRGVKLVFYLFLDVELDPSFKGQVLRSSLVN